MKSCFEKLNSDEICVSNEKLYQISKLVGEKSCKANEYQKLCMKSYV